MWEYVYKERLVKARYANMNDPHPAAHPCPAVHLLVSRPEPVAPTLICQVEKS
jgi:hypothetical protein